MNCHVPYKIRDINDKAIFEKRQIHTVLSIFFEDRLSGPTRMHLSQSIKNPPSSEIMMFSALISRCCIIICCIMGYKVGHEHAK